MLIVYGGNFVEYYVLWKCNEQVSAWKMLDVMYKPENIRFGYVSL